MKKIFGAHTMSSMFNINDLAKLKSVMATTVKHGGKLLEIPFLLCQLAWDQVAQAAKETGILEISLYHFWPIKPDGSSVCGDPLGDDTEVEKSLATILQIISVIKVLRENGIETRFIDGPLWGGLGWDYTNLSADKKKTRVISFLQKAGILCGAENVFMAVEFLRPVEDKVVGGTDKMIEILTGVNRSNVGMHFDVFHSEECGEDPALSIESAKEWIIYLHLHGSKRLAPGIEGDNCNWREIVKVMTHIESAVRSIPVVSEPFGEETRKENAALGEGLPPALPLDKYLYQAKKVFVEAGMVFD